MGQMIRNDAAVEGIVGDATKTLDNARARGGKWKDLAEQKLAPVLTLVANIEAQRRAAEETHAPLAASVEAKNERADKIIGKNYDIIWNEIGRPAWDPALAVIFPDGIVYYADGNTDDQPDRMEILVTLLSSGVHPKLSAKTAESSAAEIAAEASALRDALDAARKTDAQLKILGRVRLALGKVTHAELAGLKRIYKAEGFSEAEIHNVIPDRPQKSAKKHDASPA